MRFILISTAHTVTRREIHARKTLQALVARVGGLRRNSSYFQQKRKHLHSSAPHQQSITTMDFTHSAPSLINQPHTGTPRPSLPALRTLFVASAIPMVGFGFMDNVVMIQAGQYIDSTLGVTLGLATMTAAACGQVISDVSGVVFGGTLERFLTRMRLIQAPELTTAQRQLPLCRNVAMLGAVLGVITGCALGATTLLLVDLEARERIHRATQLRDIVADMMEDEHELPCETAIVHLVSSKHYDLHKILPGSHSGAVQLRELTTGSGSTLSLAQQCLQQKEVVCDASRQNLCAPILKEGEVMAVIEWHHKAQAAVSGSEDGNGSNLRFNEEHQKTAQFAARHIGIFMDRLHD
jgi:hypothetical protein